MTFSVDSHYLIGHAHYRQGKACQDYAFSRTDGNEAYAVVCDGCSTGGMTDVGARILAHSTASVLRSKGPQDADFPTERRTKMAQAMDSWDLEVNDLLSTCISVKVTPEWATVSIEGDGVIAFMKGSEATVVKFEWMDNVPWYPARALDKSNVERFIKDHGGDLEARRLIAGMGDFTLRHGMQGICWTVNADELENLTGIAIFSDGVDQIEGVGYESIVSELLCFKNTTGEFVKRRLNATVKRAYDSGHKPQDDLAMAVINIHHDADL